MVEIPNDLYIKLLQEINTIIEDISGIYNEWQERRDKISWPTTWDMKALRKGKEALEYYKEELQRLQKSRETKP